MMAAINYWAVLVAAVLGIVVGMVWYAPPLAGNAWNRLHGFKEPARPTLVGGVVWALSSYVMAYTLARLLVVKIGTGSVGQALLDGLLIAVGILVAGVAPMYAFSKRPWALMAIDVGYVTVAILVMSAILVAWR